MDPVKKWRRYTRVGGIWVNMQKYKALLKPTAAGCLEFAGPKHAQGYGMLGYLTEDGQRKMTVAHRVAMRMKLGRELETREDVRHACSNPACCNPAHLYIRNDDIIIEKNGNESTTKISTYAK
jgi:hypothetical protein